MRILCLVPGGIGDQILFFPTLATIRNQYPKAEIDVLVEPRAKGAYRVCPSVDAVLLFDYKDRNGLADYLDLLGVIRDHEYDIALSLGTRWTVGFLLWLSGIPKRIGYKTNNLSVWFLTDTVELNQNQYAAFMYHDLVKGLGIDVPCPPLQIKVPKIDIEWAEKEQEKLGISSGYILIHGGSSQLAVTKGIDKIYPVSQWEVIVKDIQAKQPDVPIVLLRGPDDEAWIEQMLEISSHLKVIQPPDIGKLAATIAGANLMLCTDSAPMHLAVAVGTYTIALFGPTQAEKLLPPGNENVIGIQSPTGKIADIKPEVILEQIWRG
ncbi:MAG: lipopolysaccharide heptosyltransferase family protein [Cyanobacteria bacterium J083]|nr:MAG: lipopolysaccharide heptosyltransferase family protein [Cyanobacteria bacterium J083]